MRNLLPCCLLIVIACTQSIKSNVIILDYQEFGPQVIAYKAIGKEWWQWQPHGNPRPSKYDIKVIVYRDIALEKVRNKYPVEEDKKIDFRYLEHTESLKYLDNNIDDNIMENVTEQLKKTKEKIISKLGK